MGMRGAVPLARVAAWLLTGVAIGTGAGFGAAARADEPVADTAPPHGPFTLSGNLTLASDYRFRGISQTGEDPAVQGWLTLSHESGFYATVWASSTDFRNPTRSGGLATQHAEVDAIAGYTHALGAGYTIDGGFTYYIYPGGTDLPTDYIEPYLVVSKDVGPATAKLGAAYIVGGQKAMNGADAIYLFGDLSAAIPATPLRLKGHWGYHDGVLGAGRNYADYALGCELHWKAATFGLSYVNTVGYGSHAVREANGADGTLLLSAGLSF